MSGEKKTPKTTSNIATGIAMAASIVPLVKPAIEAVRDYADKTIEERKKLVVVPKLYSSEYRTTSEQAVEILTSLGLKAVLSPTLIDDADGKYRNCINNQVIKSEPKARQKVEPGTTVRVLYITQEVIDESQRLFNEYEKRKAKLLLEKSIRHSERKEKQSKWYRMLLILLNEESEKSHRFFIKRTTTRRNTMNKNGKKRGFGGLLLDFILVLCTGGLWLIWILIRYLRNNS